MTQTKVIELLRRLFLQIIVLVVSLGTTGCSNEEASDSGGRRGANEAGAGEQPDDAGSDEIEIGMIVGSTSPAHVVAADDSHAVAILASKDEHGNAVEVNGFALVWGDEYAMVQFDSKGRPLVAQTRTALLFFHDYANGRVTIEYFKENEEPQTLDVEYDADQLEAAAVVPKPVHLVEKSSDSSLFEELIDAALKLSGAGSCVFSAFESASIKETLFECAINAAQSNDARHHSMLWDAIGLAADITGCGLGLASLSNPGTAALLGALLLKCGSLIVGAIERAKLLGDALLEPSLTERLEDGEFQLLVDETLIQRMPTEVSVTLVGPMDDIQLRSVTADLTQIGGPARAMLTPTAAGWSWRGSVTPPEETLYLLKLSLNGGPFKFVAPGGRILAQSAFEVFLTASGTVVEKGDSVTIRAQFERGDSQPPYDHFWQIGDDDFRQVHDDLSEDALTLVDSPRMRTPYYFGVRDSEGRVAADYVVVAVCGDDECSPEEDSEACAEDCSDEQRDAGATSSPEAGVDEGPPELQDYPDAPAVPVTHAQVAGKGVASGDPHLRTFDGYRYDPQPLGELTLVHDPRDDFEVQVRTAPWRSSKNVSVHVAAAVRVGEDRFALYLDQGVLVNGQAIELETGETRLPGGGVVTRNRNRYTVDLGDETLVTLVDRQNHVNVSVILPAERAGEVVGLLGDRNRDTRNDLSTREGESLGRRLKFNQLYGEFIESWRIEQANSLFDYPDGMGTEDFTDRNFPYRRAHYPDLNRQAAEQAREDCAAGGVTEQTWLEACAVDLVLTGEPEFIEGFVGLPPASEVLEVDPPPDEDADGVRDDVDNCQSIANATQRDTDDDGVGDACDEDVDGDAIDNAGDVCPSIPDPEQLDSDNDGIGDACEATPELPESDGSTLTLNVSRGGSVSVGGVDTCTASSSPCVYDLEELLAFSTDEDVVLTAIADEDYTLDHWSGDCSGAELEFAVASSGAVSCGVSFFGTEGSVELIEPPLSVVPQDTENNDAIVFFREHEGLTLTRNTPIDLHVATAYTNNADTPAFIPAGITVDVYYFHFDPIASQSVSRTATLFAPGEILGIATRTATLEATDEMFALADVLYPEPGAEPAREFELNGGDSLELLPNRRSLDVSMTTSTSADQFRMFVLSSGQPAPLLHSETIAWSDGGVDFTLGALELTGAATVYDEGVSSVSDLPTDVSTVGNYSNVTNAPAGSIPSGNVHSYYVHFDPVGSSTSTVVGTITFPTPIVGMQISGMNLDASDGPLGVAGTVYPTGESTRGADSSDTLLWSEDTRSVRFRFQANSGMDEMRILVSEP